MKRILLLAFALIVAALLPACNKSTDTEPTTIKIGVILPMTGDGSFWGKNAQRGVQIAVEELRTAKTKYKYEFIEEDSGTSPAKAVSAFNKLLSVDKIRFCIVDMISSDVLAIAPIAEKNKVLIMSPGASNPKITDAGDYVFRNWPSDALQGQEAARVVRDVLKWKRVGIIKINNDYGEGLSSVFRKHLGSAASVVAEESFDAGASTFATQLQKLKEAQADGIYLLVYPQQAPTILKQARELALTAKFLGTETLESKEVLAIGKEATEGVLYTYPKAADPMNAAVKRFRDSFQAKFKEPPGVPADVAYDAVYLFVNNIEKSAASVEEVKRLLYETKGYNGASGSISFDSNGDTIKPFELKIIRDGRFQTFD